MREVAGATLASFGGKPVSPPLGGGQAKPRALRVDVLL